LSNASSRAAHSSAFLSCPAFFLDPIRDGRKFRHGLLAFPNIPRQHRIERLRDHAVGYKSGVHDQLGAVPVSVHEPIVTPPLSMMLAEVTAPPAARMAWAAKSSARATRAHSIALVGCVASVTKTVASVVMAQSSNL
jgi:hypothetical protein